MCSGGRPRGHSAPKSSGSLIRARRGPPRREPLQEPRGGAGADDGVMSAADKQVIKCRRESCSWAPGGKCKAIYRSDGVSPPISLPVLPNRGTGAEPQMGSPLEDAPVEASAAGCPQTGSRDPGRDGAGNKAERTSPRYTIKINK